MSPYADVIGDPIAQSKSPLIHRFWLDALGMEGDYRRVHVKADALGAYFSSRRDDPAWARPGLFVLLAATTVLYLWRLADSGWANAFYSAAAQAGSKSWEAFFYGSSDAGNSITVDKPPASLWIMELSARVFGLSSWSILLPEAIMGVVTVALVYAIVRRHFSAGAALLSGGVLAITPVAALMFRFNNPDALLVLLTVLATYLTLRGIESGRIRWVIWAGVAVGFAVAVLHGDAATEEQRRAAVHGHQIHVAARRRPSCRADRRQEELPGAVGVPPP